MRIENYQIVNNMKHIYALIAALMFGTASFAQLPDGSIAPDNAALVRVAAVTAEKSARRVADADDVRQMLA